MGYDPIWAQARLMASVIATAGPKEDGLDRKLRAYLVIHDQRFGRYLRMRGIGNRMDRATGRHISPRELGIDTSLSVTATLQGLLAAEEVVEANGFAATIKAFLI